MSVILYILRDDAVPVFPACDWTAIPAMGGVRIQAWQEKVTSRVWWKWKCIKSYVY